MFPQDEFPIFPATHHLLSFSAFPGPLPQIFFHKDKNDPKGIGILAGD
jgi:hypothetical protein